MKFVFIVALVGTLSACANRQPMTEQQRWEFEQGLRLMQMSRPVYAPPPPMQPPTHCNTVPNGYGGWRTVCD